MTKPILVIHGGAGIIPRESLTPEMRQKFLDGLENALKAGWNKLESGSTATDSVAAAVAYMEDSPLFNAGCGSVFTRSGSIRMEVPRSHFIKGRSKTCIFTCVPLNVQASIMDGATRQFGAATQLKGSKNPIQLAQLILEKQPNTHGFLCGEEAEEFGAHHGLAQEPQEYFKTERRWRQHLEGLELDKRPQVSEDFVGPKGTVGAVALDSEGNLAAATSTGGKTNKMSSRLGDTPLIGCGTYAENGLVACSGTGDGEFFIRSVASYDIAAQMKYGGKSVQDASKFTLKSIEDLGGSGGLIALDSEGRFAMPNSGGMFRGWIGQDGVPHTAIFVDEEC
ncbi:isoaspartyl aminopeptidase [Chytriomyces cf. hyalinus JEL632]|nr:isoaspartyl aminopeptidase [Chytriomyces cf. hyalinus JEL632]